jgi:hypothetical protein
MLSNRLRPSGAPPRSGATGAHSCRDIRVNETIGARQRARVHRLLRPGVAEGPGDQDTLHQAGSPWENGHIESFHDKLRDECLNRELFGNLHEARIVLESWRVEYNERRPHSPLGYQTPNEYACRRTNRFDRGYAPPNPAPLAAAGVRGELLTQLRTDDSERLRFRGGSST